MWLGPQIFKGKGIPQFWICIFKSTYFRTWQVLDEYRLLSSEGSSRINKEIEDRRIAIKPESAYKYVGRLGQPINLKCGEKMVCMDTHV